MIEIKDGAAYRDGERIGTVEGQSLIVTEKLHHQVVKKLEKETGLTVVVQAPVGSAENQGVTPDSPDLGATPDKPKEPETPPVEPPEPDPAPKIEEPEPPKDHRGDKTPAFVEWMFRNRPEEAATRYANRILSRP